VLQRWSGLSLLVGVVVVVLLLVAEVLEDIEREQD
jgi:hypothetical protein